MKLTFVNKTTYELTDVSLHKGDPGHRLNGVCY